MSSTTTDAGSTDRTTIPTRPVQVDTEIGTAGRDRVAGLAAVAGGLLSFAIGVTQALYPQDLDPAIDPRTRVMLLGFTLVLWALVPVHLRLAARARSRWGAWLAVLGTPLLTVGTITSAARGLDLEIFPAIAVLANALWFVGAVALAVALWRAHRVPRPVAGLLVLVMPSSIFGSQMGGGVVAGAYLLVVGLLLLGGRLDRR